MRVHLYVRGIPAGTHETELRGALAKTGLDVERIHHVGDGYWGDEAIVQLAHLDSRTPLTTFVPGVETATISGSTLRLQLAVGLQSDSVAILDRSRERRKLTWSALRAFLSAALRWFGGTRLGRCAFALGIDFGLFVLFWGTLGRVEDIKHSYPNSGPAGVPILYLHAFGMVTAYACIVLALVRDAWRFTLGWRE